MGAKTGTAKITPPILRVDAAFRTLADSAPVLIWLSDTTSECTFFNETWLQFTGRALEEEIGAGWAEGVHPDDVERCVGLYQSAFEQREPFQMEYRLRHHSGEYRWVLDTGMPMFDEHGVFVGFAGSCVDITDRRNAESRLAALNEQLQSRLAELATANAARDELLGRVSHELRTPITTILGNAQILRRRGDRVPEGARVAALADIEQEADRLQRMIENLLVLAHMDGERAIRTIVIERVVASAVSAHLRRSPGREINVPAARSTYVLADAAFVEQILCNLLINAERFAPAGTAIDVTIEVTHHEVQVGVLDRGAGVPDDGAEAVFEASFRGIAGRRPASGAGLGLAVCKQLVEALGGRLWVSPRAGGGSQFCFTLPLVREVVR